MFDRIAPGFSLLTRERRVEKTGHSGTLDPKVTAWWKTTADGIYNKIPDIAGFVLKADSEGRLGPSAYGRSHSDAAKSP